ncbi:MAG: hypothetical protein KJ070_04315 [Verrucomicrobia bacterium]|nr:hypothetical protein [Verrucomicrobiota bacterium]
MKAISLKPELNPAFKKTQPLPLLPADFVVRHAWAARPFAALGSAAESIGRETTVTDRCLGAWRQELHGHSARLVA